MDFCDFSFREEKKKELEREEQKAKEVQPEAVSQTDGPQVFPTAR